METHIDTLKTSIYDAVTKISAVVPEVSKLNLGDLVRRLLVGRGLNLFKYAKTFGSKRYMECEVTLQAGAVLESERSLTAVVEAILNINTNTFSKNIARLSYSPRVSMDTSSGISFTNTPVKASIFGSPAVVVNLARMSPADIDSWVTSNFRDLVEKFAQSLTTSPVPFEICSRLLGAILKDPSSLGSLFGDSAGDTLRSSFSSLAATLSGSISPQGGVCICAVRITVAFISFCH